MPIQETPLDAGSNPAGLDLYFVSEIEGNIPRKNRIKMKKRSFINLDLKPSLS